MEYRFIRDVADTSRHDGRPATLQLTTCLSHSRAERMLRPRNNVMTEKNGSSLSCPMWRFHLSLYH